MWSAASQSNGRALAAVRHELRGTVTKSGSDGTGKVSGTITTFLCENGVRTDQIVSRYKARFSRVSERQQGRQRKMRSEASRR